MMIHANTSSLDSLPLVRTVPEAAEALRIGRNTAYELVRCGRIHGIRIGRQLRVPKSTLLSYLNEGN